MTYDALGRRVEQAVGTTYTEIVYGPGGGKLALVNGTDGAGQAVISAFIPLPAGATAVYAGNTLSRYRHSDWLGSSRLSSTPTQPTSVLYDGAYSPMGESYSESGTKDRNFTGQNQDLTTDPLGDLYDFMYREYHPIHGRWISPDPAGIGAVNPANPQSWNRYAYVNGDPLRHRDPEGLCVVSNDVTLTGPDTSCNGSIGSTVASMNHYDPGQGVYPIFTSWTEPPKYLANQGTIHDSDIGAVDEGYYAQDLEAHFWRKLFLNIGLKLSLTHGLDPATGAIAPPTYTDQPNNWGGPLPFAPDPVWPPVPGVSCGTGSHLEPDPSLTGGTCQLDPLPQPQGPVLMPQLWWWDLALQTVLIPQIRSAQVAP